MNATILYTWYFQISHGADLEMRSSLGYTPLHVAAHYGQVEVARILLEAGAKPDQEDLQVNKCFKKCLSFNKITQVANEELLLVHTHTHTHAHPHAHTLTLSQTHPLLQTHPHEHAHTPTNSHPHTLTNTHVHTHRLTNTYWYTF